MAQEFSIRMAKIDDMKNVFELSNEDLVRQNSIHTEKIDWETHVEWFKARINKIDEPFYIVEDKNGKFMGQLRFDKQNDDFVVSVSISPEFRGKGLASEILSEAIKKSGLKNLSAYIFDFNEASKNAFEKAGFKKDNLIKYVYNSVTTTVCKAGGLKAFLQKLLRIFCECRYLILQKILFLNIQKLYPKFLIGGV